MSMQSARIGEGGTLVYLPLTPHFKGVGRYHKGNKNLRRTEANLRHWHYFLAEGIRGRFLRSKQPNGLLEAIYCPEFNLAHARTKANYGAILNSFFFSSAGCASILVIYFGRQKMVVICWTNDTGLSNSFVGRTETEITLGYYSRKYNKPGLICSLKLRIPV